MNAFSREDIREMIVEAKSPTVSLFLPTYRGGTDAFQNPVRLKNLLTEAERELQAQGIANVEREALLKPAQALLAGPAFWEHPGNGLAVFLAPGLFRAYHLPLAVAERVVVTPTPYLKPLIPLLNSNERFYVLALSQNAVRLLEATRHTVREITPAGIPKNLAETLRYDDPERQLGGHSLGAGRRIVYHGQTIDREEEKEQLRRYFRQIDQALPAAMLVEKAPLVLAGVPYLFPLYAEVSVYPHLLPDGIPGNPEHSDAASLHHRAWTIVAPVFQKERRQAWEQYERRLGMDTVSDDFCEIIPAAYYGRVETLFVRAEPPLWGVFNPEAGKVHLHRNAEPGDEDLTNLAVVRTLLDGGTVYAAEASLLPAERPLAALFRY